MPIGRPKKPNRTLARYLAFEAGGTSHIRAVFGSDPEVMAEAARVCQDLGFDFLDINFGCPVKKVVKCNGGSGLLRDLPLVENISAHGATSYHYSVHLQVPRGLERS